MQGFKVGCEATEGCRVFVENGGIFLWRMVFQGDGCGPLFHQLLVLFVLQGKSDGCDFLEINGLDPMVRIVVANGLQGSGRFIEILGGEKSFPFPELVNGSRIAVIFRIIYGVKDPAHVLNGLFRNEIGKEQGIIRLLVVPVIDKALQQRLLVDGCQGIELLQDLSCLLFGQVGIGGYCIYKVPEGFIRNQMLSDLGAVHLGTFEGAYIYAKFPQNSDIVAQSYAGNVQPKGTEKGIQFSGRDAVFFIGMLIERPEGNDGAQLQGLFFCHDERSFTGKCLGLEGCWPFRNNSPSQPPAGARGRQFGFRVPGGLPTIAGFLR